MSIEDDQRIRSRALELAPVALSAERRRPALVLHLAVALTLGTAVLILCAGCGGDSGVGPDGEDGADLRHLDASSVSGLPALSGTRGPPSRPLTLTGWTAVPLSLADPAGIPPEPQVICSHGLSPSGEGWRIDSPGSRLVRSDEGPLLELGAGHSDQALIADLPGVFEVQTLERVLVHGRFEGSGSLVVSLLRKDRVLRVSDPLVLPSGGALADFALDLHRPDDELEPEPLSADTLRIECLGGYRRLVLTSVQLLQLSPSSMLPDPRGAPRWSGLGASSRPALGLHRGLPLVGEADVPAHGVLDLSLAASEMAGGVQLIISDGTRQERRGLGVAASSAGWQDITVPLDGWADRHVTFQLRWDQPSAAMVGPLSVGSPDPEVGTLVLITSSSHRGDHLGLAFRGIDIDTPNLDALAGRGVFFSDAQTVCNSPRPALASLLCGRTPRDTGLLDESDRLAEAAPTLAERLAAVGWRCEAVLATRSLRPLGSGLGQGFSRVEAPRESWRWDASEVVVRARQRLGPSDGRPLFLWLHLADGEWPHEPTGHDLARYYRPQDDPCDPGYKRPKIYLKTMPLPYREVRDLNWPRARYKACLTSLDRALAPLLGDSRVQRGTVVFVGSQGLSLGEHSIWFKHLGLYPGVLHVPLIIASGDGSWPVGERCEVPVSTLGLAATLARQLGASAEGWQGGDLLASARGELPPSPRFAVEDHAQSAAVTAEGMHLVVSLQQRNSPHLLERRKLGELELYDLRHDWNAQVPVSMEADDSMGKRLGLLLLRWLSEAENLGWARAGALDEAQLVHLEQLGYTGPAPRTPENPWSLEH